jgi:hypothetical protein
MEALLEIPMNIHEPTTSRILAILIQNIHGDDRQRFREDAEKAPDMDTFIKGMGQYRAVPE